eukprot:CAMPEP_0174321452 /NCGR_PEP_ID=MMETSP0810-20121108/10311_1 /TAXON_ID=73025 ORGANISM="Eutreptiella gymnastica-like, Strain CCMP1594" /NCGR_SAMPLE_ID=MMETSP0810 /ASSEMBLY_ACC=CAM_ASM_000659 /LENGTH=110 /DNA_ID=CAMNT_0015432873 /DNA_START=83 /DNA_END=415 /DNA_ORIENTATION=-
MALALRVSKAGAQAEYHFLPTHLGLKNNNGCHPEHGEAPQTGRVLPIDRRWSSPSGMTLACFTIHCLKLSQIVSNAAEPQKESSGRILAKDQRWSPPSRITVASTSVRQV